MQIRHSIYVTKKREVPRSRSYGDVQQLTREEAYATRESPPVMVGTARQPLEEEPLLVAPRGYNLISDRQKSVHQGSEMLAVWIGLPFFTYLALNGKLPGWARLLSAAFGIGTLVVDGGLLATWAAKEEGKEGPYSSYQQG